MDSLLPTTTRSEPLPSGPRAPPPPDDRREDAGFGPELARQLREERRSSRPPSAAEASLSDEARSGGDDVGGAGEAEAGGEAARGDETPGDEGRSARPLTEPRGALGSPTDASRWMLEPTGLLGAGLPTVAMNAATATPGATTEASGHVDAAPTKPVAFAAVERVTEEQVNVRKLVRYLVGQTATGAGEKARADRADPSPPVPPNPEPDAPANAQPPPEPELHHHRSNGTPAAQTDPSHDLAPPPSKSLGADGVELSRPFDPGARVQVATMPEADTAAREQQLRAAAHRALNEARQRMLEPGRLRDGRLSVTLDVREASIPMRLRFSPDGRGGQNVAFLVSTAKDLRELRRLMPEIETVLTELPVEVSDVNVDVDSFRDRPTSPARGERG